MDTGYEIVGMINEAPKVMPALLRHKPDVVLLDIDLGQSTDGIQLAHQINKLLPTPIIFTTGRTDNNTIKDAIAEMPISYLVKPITKSNLIPAIELALFKNINVEYSNYTPSIDAIQKNSEAVFLQSKGSLVKVSFEDVCAITVKKDRYISVITTNDEHVLRSSIKEILKKLPDFFTQIHRSTIVNIRLLEKINDFEGTVTVNNKNYPLGNTYRQKLTNSINII